MKTPRILLPRAASTALLVALFLACPSTPLSAAGDEGGWLPGQAGGVTEGGEDETQSLLGTQVVEIASPEGLVEAEILDGATLDVRSSTDGSMTLAPEATGGSDAPITAASYEPITYSQGLYGGTLQLQGKMLLKLDSELEMTLGAAVFATQRQTILMLHEVGPSEEMPALADVLAGQIAPLAFAVTGDMADLDIAKFHALVTKHAANLPDVVATWAFVSVDALGEVAVSGVRVSTDGETLEVLAD